MKSPKFRTTLVLLVLITACGPFPKDSKNTLQTVQNNVLIVGLSAYDSTANASGRNADFEIFLINKFAEELNSKVEWVKGSQSEIVSLLHNNNIHMAIGGYTSPSPFEKEVSFSRPYLLKKIRVGLKGTVPAPAEIKNRKVLVSNYMAGFYVKQKGGIPVMSDTLADGNYLVAGSEGELRKWNARFSNIVLHEEKFVVAIPKGENAFLIKLEHFIDKYGRSE